LPSLIRVTVESGKNRGGIGTLYVFAIP